MSKGANPFAEFADEPLTSNPFAEFADAPVEGNPFAEFADGANTFAGTSAAPPDFAAKAAPLMDDWDGGAKRQRLPDRMAVQSVTGREQPGLADHLRANDTTLGGYAKDTLAQGGIGLQQGFHAIGEQGMTAGQLANEPILKIGPLAITATGPKPAALAKEAAQFFKEAADLAHQWGQAKGELSKETGGIQGAATLTSGAMSLLPVIAAGPLGAATGVAMSGAQQGLSTLSEAQRAFEQQGAPAESDRAILPNQAFGKSLMPAAIDALQTAGITALSGRLFGPGAEGLTLTAKRAAINDRVMEAAKAVVGESLEEGAQQFISDFVIAKLTYNPGMTLEEATKQAVSAAAVGGILGGGVNVAGQLMRRNMQAEPPVLPTTDTGTGNKGAVFEPGGMNLGTSAAKTAQTTPVTPTAASTPGAAPGTPAGPAASADALASEDQVQADLNKVLLDAGVKAKAGTSNLEPRTPNFEGGKAEPAKPLATVADVLAEKVSVLDALQSELAKQEAAPQTPDAKPQTPLSPEANPNAERGTRNAEPENAGGTPTVTAKLTPAATPGPETITGSNVRKGTEMPVAANPPAPSGPAVGETLQGKAWVRNFTVELLDDSGKSHTPKKMLLGADANTAEEALAQVKSEYSKMYPGDTTKVRIFSDNGPVKIPIGGIESAGMSAKAPAAADPTVATGADTSRPPAAAQLAKLEASGKGNSPQAMKLRQALADSSPSSQNVSSQNVSTSVKAGTIVEPAPGGIRFQKQANGSWRRLGIGDEVSGQAAPAWQAAKLEQAALTDAAKGASVAVAGGETITVRTDAGNGVTDEQTGSLMTAEASGEPAAYNPATSPNSPTLAEQITAAEKTVRTRTIALERAVKRNNPQGRQTAKERLDSAIAGLKALKERRAYEARKARGFGTERYQADRERGMDLIDDIKATVGSFDYTKSKHEDPHWKPTGAARALQRTGGRGLDVALHALHADGMHLGITSTDELRAALTAAAQARKGARSRVASENRALDDMGRQLSNFQNDLEKQPKKNQEPIVADNLNAGDVFEMNGARFKVTALEFDDNQDVASVTLEDGKRYGTQTVDGETRLLVDKGTLEKKEQAVDFAEAPEPAESKPIDGIQDFGEKLGGARKDMGPAVQRDISDGDLATMSFSEIWPKAEVEAIEDIRLAALATVVRDEVPAKPRVGYKVKRWVSKVKMVREIMRLAQERGVHDILNRMPEFRLEQLVNKIKVLEAVPRQQWGRIGKVEFYPDAYRYEEGGKKVASPFARAEVDGKNVQAENMAGLIDMVSSRLAGEVASPKMQFEVRGRRDGTGGFSINKKGDPIKRKLKTFPTAEEALAYARKADNYDALVQAWEGVKATDNVKETDVRGDENRPRRGGDHRQGRDATPEMFMSAFGFRGVEFGNWVSQGANTKERQGMLNAAFDGLMDLANILGIPARAVSLNGTLGLGMGSRGHGWASAHYEPDTLVINLTKTRGAGTLAHEWFHALDNYFQRLRNPAGIKGRAGDYITQQPEAYYENEQGHRLSEKRFQELSAMRYNAGKMDGWKRIEGVRPQVAEAFAELVSALDKSPMAKRAAAIDAGKSNGYWSRIIERAARSFENYMIAKMAQQGYHNDYLANVTSVEDFARDKGRYPYLLTEETAPIVAAFDNLFATIETEETPTGVRMFAEGTGGGMSVTEAEAVILEALGMDSLPRGIRVVSEPGASWGARIDDRNTITVNAAQVSGPARLQQVILEEGLHGVWNEPDVQAAWRRFRDGVTPTQAERIFKERKAKGLPHDPATIREETAIDNLLNEQANRGLLAKLLDALRAAFKRVFGVTLPGGERAELLTAAQAFLRGQRETLSTDMAPAFAESDATVEQWRRDFLAAQLGALKGRTLKLGHTSPALQAAGIPAGEIYITQETLIGKPKQAEHVYPVTKLFRLPEALRDPILVHESWTQPDAFMALLDIQYQGQHLAAALHFRTTEQGLEVTEVSSVYPREESKVLAAIERGVAGRQGGVTYYHKEKIRDWLAHSSGSNSPHQWVQMLGQTKAATNHSLGQAGQNAAGDFSFDDMESVADAKARKAAEQRQQRTAAARNDMQDRAQARISGADVDTNAEMFGAEVKVDKAGQGSLFAAGQFAVRGKYWMRPDGSLAPVEDHEPGAAQILGKSYDPDDSWMDRHSSELTKQGWVRMVRTSDRMYFTGQPSASQLRELKDIAIENRLMLLDANPRSNRVIYEPESQFAAGNVLPGFAREEHAFVKGTLRRATENVLRGTSLPKPMVESREAASAFQTYAEKQITLETEDLRAAINEEFKAKPDRDAANARLLQYLEGDADLNTVGGPAVQRAAKRVRDEIDELSLFAVRSGMVHGPMAETWLGNTGAWLKRTYLAFDAAADWNYDTLKRRKDKGDSRITDIWNGIEGYLRKQNPNMTDGHIEAVMRELIDRQAVESALGLNAGGMAGSGKRLTVETSSLLKRKVLAPEVRAWMGEIKDPYARVLQSGKWLAQFTARNLAQRHLANIGLEMGILSKEKTGRFTEELYPPESRFVPKLDADGKPMTDADGNPLGEYRTVIDRRHEPLSGYFTTPEFVEALNEFDQRMNNSIAGLNFGTLAGRALLSATAWQKGALVGWNPYSYVVNSAGGFIMRLAAGAVNPIHFARAFNAVASGQKVLTDKTATVRKLKARADYLMAVQAGTTGNGVLLGDIRANLQSEYKSGGWPRFGQAVADIAKDPKAGGAWVRMREAISDLWRAPGEWGIRFFDDVFRISALFDELSLAKEAHPEWTEKKQIEWAGDRASNIYQTYERLPKVLRDASRVGALNTFVSFKFELFRNAFWIARYAAQGIKSDNPAIRRDGYQKAIGLIVMGAAPLMVAALSRGLNDVDDDEDKALKRWVVAPWDRSEELVYLPTGDGTYRYVPIGYLLPTYELTRPMNSLWKAAEDPNPEEAFTQLASGWISDYAGPGAGLGPLLEAGMNDRIGQNRPLTLREGAGGISDRLGYVASSFTPRMFKVAQESYMAASGETGDYGRTYSQAEIALKLSGFRARTVDPSKAAPFVLRGLAGRWRDASTFQNTEERKAGTNQARIDAANAYEQETKANLARLYKQATDDLQTLGVPLTAIIRAEKEAAIPEDLRRARNGLFPK